MAAENKKLEKSENQTQKKPNNFFIHELKERAEIIKQSHLFKKSVDDEKARQLQMIEEGCKIRKDAISDKISKLEGALNGDDPELIKEMLKNMQI